MYATGLLLENLKQNFIFYIDEQILKPYYTVLSRLKSPIRGVIAALLLPRDSDDQPIWDALEQNVAFLLRAGVKGVCINGATGEYTGASPSERLEAIRRARRIAGDELLILSGAGASRWAEAVHFVRGAALAGADSVLVPPPHFFKYEQEDLREFYRSISAESPVPVLLYNLPAFTTGLDPKVAAELIRTVPGIEGVKDSSGELKLLSILTNNVPTAVRFMGNDAVLGEALENQLCDGAVSGVAGVLPELTLALWRSGAERDMQALRRWSARLDNLLNRLDAFPTPWGLKFIAEFRGLARANPALPLSAKRRDQVEDFRCWFRGWWQDAEHELDAPLLIDSSRTAA